MDTKYGRLKGLSEVLLPWFYENLRDLPWRCDREPYHIWVSEIMLQQTRVEAVKGYYARFLKAIPTISDLANADEEKLHKLWEGLGYYSRVRNMKKAACMVTEKFGGIFPTSYCDVLSLPGVGEYTAGAICSICYDLKTPAVDGNVLRVVSRLMNDPTPIDLPVMKKRVKDILLEIYPDRAGDFTQALMELGATLCGPNRQPQCDACPCKEMCLANLQRTAQSLPVRLPKKQRRQEDMTVFIIESCGHYALQKRSGSGLLAGLWQFPNTPGHLDISETVSYLERLGISVSDIQRQVDKTHIFTHVQWNMRGYFLQAKNMAGPFVWHKAETICKNTALPTAFRVFWEEREFIKCTEDLVLQE